MKFFIPMLIFCSVLISAQQTKILDNFSMKASSYDANVFEKSNLNIYYQFKFLKDAKVSQNPREGLCVLQIGENYLYTRPADIESAGDKCHFSGIRRSDTP